MRLDRNIESKSLNNTYLNIIEIFNKLFFLMNIIEIAKFGSNIGSEKG